jgi:lysophospholipase L1-like esterase
MTCLKKIPGDSTILNLKIIVEKIKTKSPKTTVYIESVLPMKNDQALIDTLNKAIRILCNTHKISFINLDPVFLKDGLNPKYDFGDGVHLNSKGYFAWKSILVPYIQE